MRFLSFALCTLLLFSIAVSAQQKGERVRKPATSGSEHRVVASPGAASGARVRSADDSTRTKKVIAEPTKRQRTK